MRMQKTSLYGLIVPLFLGLSFSVASASPFTDVGPNHLNSEAIGYVQEQGIVSGYPDGSFRPNAIINRAEFTKIIVAATVSEREIQSCTMGTDKLTGYVKDIPSNSWFTPYICTALEYEYVYGYPDGTFRPADEINFVEAAKILAVAYGFSNPSYSDKDTGIWYRPYVTQLEAYKAIPMSIRSFDQKFTRGEMAEIVWRLKKGILDRPSRTYNELMGLPIAEQQEEKGKLTVSFVNDPNGEAQMIFTKNGDWHFNNDFPLKRPITYVGPDSYPSPYHHGELAAFYLDESKSRTWYILIPENGKLYVNVYTSEPSWNGCLTLAWHVALFPYFGEEVVADGQDRNASMDIPERCTAQ